MEDRRYLECIEEISYILLKNHKVFKVSQQFAEITEYTTADLLGKSIAEIFKILRVGPSVDIKNIAEKADYFLFTKSLEFRSISIEIIKEEDSQLFIIREKPNSRLEAKHTYLSELCKSNFVGVAVYSVPDMILIKANQQYLDFLEPPFNQSYYSIGKNIDKIIFGWSGSKVEKFWKEAILTGKAVQVKEYEHIGYERGITYWDSIIIPVTEGESIKYVVSNTSEVTEKVLNRKKVEEQIDAINLQNKEMEAVFESIPNGVFVRSKEGDILQQNEISRKLIEHSNESKTSYGKNSEAKYFNESGKEIDIEDMPSFRALKGEKIKNQRITVVDNGKESVLDMSSSPIYDKENTVLMSVTAFDDITELVSNEKKIRNNREQLKAIIDNMSDGVVAIGKCGNLVMLNKAAEKHFNVIKIIEGRNKNDSEIKYFDVNMKELREGSLPSDRILRGEIITEYRIIIKRYSENIYMCISGSPVYDDSGNFLFGMMCMKDVTEKVKQERIIKSQHDSVLQAEFERNETLEKTIAMKDEFLSIISHEFRTPLNVINSAVQAMEYICFNELSNNTKKYLGMIKLNTFRQLRLVNNILDITSSNLKSTKINKKNIDIVFFIDAIVESVRSYASKKEIDLILETSYKEFEVAIDNEKFARILLNLLSNAIKFTSDNKKITVRFNALKENIFIEVSDEGIGIPSDKIDTIFEQFGQVDSSLSRQVEGTGLGLSLVKKFVEDLGGRIFVNSKVSKGSAFIVMLPNEKVTETYEYRSSKEFFYNHILEATRVEFSDIYL
ncbi:sensor histidine kinase [Clostridium beijerinckii]|uniref:sensor histidine kinase n=1 Tax=Clostridium beijerinckii TaxID=1520 RepID=UPI00098CEA88|nr:PAS domain-containing sensor histidine kinase [Clostridium beijerinckii]MBA8933361.1 signal transduction histidine kinase [Clostridium beijerinckii]NRT36692.1 signal transduction histidine kinase [Clostridium beijerinckii]NRT43875.1 signal transduction histidine kinase [Clostridium beijerinckii]NRU37562.1 signal transduction histidine kinase [Clostridium beijerinckii]NRZ22131.1 signal transduction histidine kinase [Clostridium beijerinckii]